jgi:hypothetical protein
VGVDDLYDLFLTIEEPGGDGVAAVTFNQDGVSLATERIWSLWAGPGSSGGW